MKIEATYSQENNIESNQEKYQHFKNVIQSIITRINEKDPNMPSYMATGKNSKSYEEEGTKIYIPSRPGKHVQVFFVDIEKEHRKFECVLRSFPKEAEIYKENLNKKPIIGNYLPKLYDVVEGWVIMERMHGAESGIEEKLKDDDFRMRYAKNCAEIMFLLANNDVSFNDVGLYHGQNTIVGEDASPKFVEQTALIPEKFKDLDFTLDEVFSNQIFNEFWHKSSHIHIDKKLHFKTDEHYYDFHFQLLSELLSKIDPEKVRIQHRYLKNNHPLYKNSFNNNKTMGLPNTVETEYLEELEYWKTRPINDNELAALTESDKPIIPFMRDSNESDYKPETGIRLNPKLIDAVKNHSIEEFRELFYAGESIIPLENIKENQIIL